MKNLRKSRDMKLVTSNVRRNYLVELRNHTTVFSQNLLAIEMKKLYYSWIKRLFRSINIRIGIILLYEFCYDYTKPKNGEKQILCYMDANSVIVYIKTKYIYVDFPEGVETNFSTSNFWLERPLPREEYNWVNERWIRWKK